MEQSGQHALRPVLVRLRPVSAEDEGLYLRLRGHDDSMAELGGALPADQIKRSLRREIRESAAGRALSVIVEVNDDGYWVSTGNITLVRDDDGVSEIGWMLEPEKRGRGIMKCALRMFLADLDRVHWDRIHAYPSVTNAPSNALCAASGFVLVGTRRLHFAGLEFLCNDWQYAAAPSTA